MRRALLWLALAAVVPSLARADARAAEGRFFDERGRAAYARGRYAEAVEHFLTSHRASPNPRALYNVATAAYRARQLALAFTSFEEYLASDDDDAAHRVEATRRRDELAARLALVEVITEPPGAALYVERRERGIAARSPARLPLTAGGEVRVIAELDGHHRAEGVVTAAIGGSATLSLTLAPRTGRLEVVAQPASASITVTRDATDAAVSPGELPVGTYRVRVAADGYVAGAETARVREGETARVEVSLEAEPRPMGRLLVDGPPGARVVVDGRDVGLTPLGVALPVGEHEVTVRGHGPPRRVVLTADRPLYVDVGRARPRTR